MSKYKLKSQLENFLIYHPYNFWVQIRSFFETKLNNTLKTELENNKTLRNKYLGERCFIIGNGPSLRNQDLIKLKGEYIFVTNNFILNERASDINPSFYCIIDPMIHNGTFPVERLRDIEKQLSNIKLIFRYASRDFIQKNSLFKNNDVYYLFDKAVLNENYLFDMNLDSCIPASINVILSCIISASYMGFSEIYLLGCDATLFIPKPEHFYKSTKEEENKKESMEDKLMFASLMFKGYRILNEYCTKKGIKIYNATDGGALDVFPRVEYENIVK
ncbi:MAG: DUF115 domain-containing protein [Clostridiaceae bacterium]|nr:DUF115 domain-containing protein [Clostridiaceae bacterium]